MLRKTLFSIAMMAAISSCAPAYAQATTLNEANCPTAKSMARQILIDLQQGKTLFQTMKTLNDRSLKDYGTNGEAVKLYLQVNTSAFALNLKRGHRVQKILQIVDEDCRSRIGKPL